MADHIATPPSLLPANRRIVLSGEDALRILCEIEFLLMSLNNIGRHYYPDGADDGADAQRRARYCAETTRFIDAQQATMRLALMRRILSAPFDSTLGEDDMDDIERAVKALPLWRAPGR
ncbi:hypothetical protein CLU90_3140 [Janthinobacterium sp. 67]|uniref:hypothetical protein n=1 Tax=Janthinobacterium sp. 67 TaxID=2035207 RepID=UPI000CA6F86E|nr:hypothetical protein [Janthinobacterium sp. 67]PJJ19908.1 hypothetical protein CLU90_3140 [Janthinobacterium sp. 67]